MDPVTTAVVGWVTSQAGTAGLHGLRRLLLGDKQQNALRSVVHEAIGAAVEMVVVPGDREVVQEVLLRESPDGTEVQVRDVPRLAEAVLGQVLPRLGTLTEQGYSIDVALLAEVLASEIGAGIQANAARGGALTPFAEFLRHERVAAAAEETVEQLRAMNRTLGKALMGSVPGSVSGVAGPSWAAAHTLPADIASFTGRSEELNQLLKVVAGSATNRGVVGISAIDGMAGIGKTALAVHAAHRLAPQFPDGQLFMRLHGHTPGQRPVEPAEALATLLLSVGVAAQQVPTDLEARAGLWRDRMAGKRVLLLLDDATGSDQVRPLLPGSAGTLVLVTSRRRLAALHEAASVSLDALGTSEAAELFVQLAERPGLLASDSAVVQTVTLCGRLPLAISLMAGQLKHHQTWSVADVAADLALAQDRLAAIYAEDTSVAAAFDLSYRDLPEEHQQMFRRLGLLPGTDVDAFAAAALGGVDLAVGRRLLTDLGDHHLIDEPARGRYQMHDLIRHYSRMMAAADEPAARDAATNRLLDYYLYTARAADHHLARRTPAYVPALHVARPSCAPDLSTREQAITWMDAERLDLHAAADFASSSGRYSHAIALPLAMHGFLRTQGHWDQAMTLHHTAQAAAQRARDPLGEAGALSDLGTMQRLTGDLSAATASQEQAFQLYRDTGNRIGQATTLNALGTLQHLRGDYAAAAASLEQALQLYRDLGDRLGQANVLNVLGTVQRLIGDFPAATASQEQAIELYRDIGNRIGEAFSLNDLGLAQQATGDYPSAAVSQEQALQLYRDLGDRLGEAETLNSIGELLLATSKPSKAEAHYQQALEIARGITAPLEEARAHEGIGRCHLHDGRVSDGSAQLVQALAIYNRLGVPDARRVRASLHTLGFSE